MTEIHHHLGVCPQFDIHHEQLTAEEHLYFYARLKGVRRSKEKAVVERALRQVSMEGGREGGEREGRFKGVCRSKEKAVVERALRQVREREREWRERGGSRECGKARRRLLWREP